ncbi:ABC transporter ATP-binding protein [Inquilinus limosus]
MGPGLGLLFQHVRGADRDGAGVLRPDHAAVPAARPALGLAEGGGAMVAAAIQEAPESQARGARIEIRDVSHQFELDGAALPVLDRIRLTIEPGEFVALLGPSGCGKSTLLRLVAGLEPPTAGAILADGAAIRSTSPSRVVVFQDPTLFPWRTVWDNVALGPQAQGLLRSRRGRVDEALRLVGLSGFGRAYPRQLSGGMAQRAALARALVNDPSLLILDEPLGKLDSLTRLTMQGELVDLWQRRGFSALLVTHDVEEALILASRVIVLSDRPARILAEIVNDRPYPRHRGDPHLAALRHEALRLLGLDAGW